MSVPADLSAAWRQAVAALQSGDAPQAERHLREVLAASPKHAEGEHLLAVALCRQGRVEEGLAAFDRAIALAPGNPDWFGNRAHALLSAGRAADAERDYRRSLALRPADPAALYNLGLLLQRAGRVDEAIASYRKALQLRPAFAAAHNNLANILQGAGRAQEAFDHYAQAIRHDPNLADAHANFGHALRDAGRIDEAVALLERAERLRPGDPDILNNLGVAYYARNRFGDAEAAYRRALGKRPADPVLMNNLGNAIAAAGRDEEAIALYREVIALAPGHADAHSNLGLQLQERGDVAGAMAAYAQALALDPAHADAINNHGYLLQEEGRLDEAMALYRRALEADPRSARAAYNLGLAHLARFEFAPGWRGAELRYFTTPPIAVARPFAVPAFSAADWGRGEKLAVWKEQGLGDQLLYATLLPELAARGQPFVAEVDRRLVPAFQRSHPDWNVVAPDDSAQAFAGCTRHAAFASLPGLLRNTRESFAAQPAALLTADPARREAIRERVAAPGTRVVGISWRSFQPKARGYLQRKKSAPLCAFAALSRRGGLRLLDLQYGDTVADREAFAAQGGRLEHLDDLDLFDDIEGALAATAACDLVVTTSNVTAHFAGALGIPTWLVYLRGNAPFHYWVPDASGRCLWYPSVRIVTGPHFREWETLLAQVDERLDA